LGEGIYLAPLDLGPSAFNLRPAPIINHSYTTGGPKRHQGHQRTHGGSRETPGGPTAHGGSKRHQGDKKENTGGSERAVRLKGPKTHLPAS
jgi:hypothetical protein